MKKAFIENNLSRSKELYNPYIIIFNHYIGGIRVFLSFTLVFIN